MELKPQHKVLVMKALPYALGAVAVLALVLFLV